MKKAGDVLFFETPGALRAWFERNHAAEGELWVGFWKTSSGRASVTWPQSVDEALCFGWIDGLRKSLDEESYKIRFTPRRAGSIWSAVNVRRVGELAREGRMTEAGERAFAARRENRVGIYSHEQEMPDLPADCVKKMKRARAAWKFWEGQPRSYRKAATWWIVSAKRDETRARRLDQLIECSARGERIPQFTWKAKDTGTQ